MSKEKNTISSSKTMTALNDTTGEIFLRSGDVINIVIDGDPPGDAFVGTVSFEVRYPKEAESEYHNIKDFTAQITEKATINADGFYRLTATAFTSGPIIAQMRGR